MLTHIRVRAKEKKSVKDTKEWKEPEIQIKKKWLAVEIKQALYTSQTHLGTSLNKIWTDTQGNYARMCLIKFNAKYFLVNGMYLPDLP